MNHSELHPDVSIGHVHLRVADIERAMVFYCNAPGFAVTPYGPDHGLKEMAFLACRARKDETTSSMLTIRSKPTPKGGRSCTARTNTR